MIHFHPTYNKPRAHRSDYSKVTNPVEAGFLNNYKLAIYISIEKY